MNPLSTTGLIIYIVVVLHPKIITATIHLPCTIQNRFDALEGVVCM